MTPGVSAGSNHVGASETWTAIVSWPSGAAAAGVATGESTATVRASRSAGGRDERRTLTVSSVLSIESVRVGVIRVHLDAAAYTVGPFIIWSMKTSGILADAQSILDDTIQM